MVTDRNSLSRFIDAFGGITAAEAESRVILRLDLLKEKALSEIDESLDSINGYLVLLQGCPPAAVKDEVHRLSCSINNLAGTFNLETLGKAAHSLCSLIDKRNARGRWDREGVDVHFDAMRLLRRPETLSPSVQARLLEGLERVLLHMDGKKCS